MATGACENEYKAGAARRRTFGHFLNRRLAPDLIWTKMPSLSLARLERKVPPCFLPARDKSN